jgi:hypothetical protein
LIATSPRQFEFAPHASAFVLPQIFRNLGGDNENMIFPQTARREPRASRVERGDTSHPSN